MSGDQQLTDGICQRLNAGDKDDESLWNSMPTLQFLSIKKVVASGATNPSNNQGASTADRYRIIISDGQHFLQAMLATQLNYLVEEDRIGKNTIAVIETMSCQHILDKRSVCPPLLLLQMAHYHVRLVILLGLRVLQRDAQKIGNPAPILPPPQQSDPVATTSVTTAPVSSPAAQPQKRQAETRGNPVYPITGLTPYQNNWRIKARVVQKSDIRTYSNQRGEGRLFSVVFMDDSAEIKGTAWNAMVDELYDKLQENRVYFVSRARVNLAKKKFSTVNNDYELGLDRGIEIEEVRYLSHFPGWRLNWLQCHDTDVPVIRYNFVNLSTLSELLNEAICGMFLGKPQIEDDLARMADVIVIVREVGNLTEITTKNNKTVCLPEYEGWTRLT